MSEPPAPEKEEESPPPKMEEKVLTSPKHEAAPRKGKSETDSGTAFLFLLMWICWSFVAHIFLMSL